MKKRNVKGSYEFLMRFSDKAIEWLAFKTVENVTGTPYPFIPMSIVGAVMVLLLWKKKEK